MCMYKFKKGLIQAHIFSSEKGYLFTNLKMNYRRANDWCEYNENTDSTESEAYDSEENEGNRRILKVYFSFLYGWILTF